jgi:exosortase
MPDSSSPPTRGRGAEARTVSLEEGPVTRYLHSRKLLLLFFSIVTLVAFYRPLSALFVRSLHDPVNDYILVIPLVSAYFFYLNRNEIFSVKAYSFRAGIGIILLGVAVCLTGLSQENRLNQNDFLSVVALSIVIIWMGGFALFYGLEAFRKAIFPLLFLLLVVPIPSLFLEKTISVLQEGSAEAALAFFKLSGVPVLREGFVFHLSRLSIEVAEQCSGIHSAIALLITSIIAGKLFLATGWKKLVLMLLVFPIAIIKNGMRIVTLSLLGNYVDERILSSSLHKEGGIPFFLLGVSILFAILWLLRRTEKKAGPRIGMRRSSVSPEVGNHNIYKSKTF